MRVRCLTRADQGKQARTDHHHERAATRRNQIGATNDPSTFTTVAPRRSSIVMSCAVASGGFSAAIGMNAGASTLDGADVAALTVSIRFVPRDLFLGHDPAPHQVRVQPVGQRHRGHRYTRLTGGCNNLGLELRIVLAPTPPRPVAVIRSVHVSTKNRSGHDPPYPNSAEQDDFARRLRKLFATSLNVARDTAKPVLTSNQVRSAIE
jgi:hypothetical protein